MLTVNVRNLRASHELIWFIVDMTMLFLLFVNLAWLILDFLYGVEGVRDLLADFFPAAVEAYRPIHRNFFFYDLIFVAIFLTEFVIRWIRSVYAGEHDRWYFYPFAHWYDLLGCIPVGGWRVLRLLRVISIVHRLHQYGVIDLTQLRAWRFLKFYYEAFMEELSDRIVIKVLSGAQDELREGSPMLHRVQQEILLPRRDLIVDWISEKVSEVSRDGYMPNEPDMRQYLERVVDEVMRKNTDLGRIRQIPVFGSTVSDTLERAVGDIAADVMQRVMEDLASRNNHAFIEDLVAVFLRTRTDVDPRVDVQFKGVMIEVIDILKEQVQVKRWRQDLDSATTTGHALRTDRENL